MKTKKWYWVGLLVLSSTLAACGSDNTPNGGDVSGLASDGNIERAEASALVSRRSETGEPAEVNDVNLNKSETDEPFEI